MQPGIPALLLLAATTVAGLALGFISTSSQINDPGRRGVLVHAISNGVVALFFWLWAMKKVLLEGDPDIGAVSFALLIISSVHAHRVATSQDVDMLQRRRFKRQRVLLVVATVVIVLNYSLALFIDLPPTFRLYLAVGAFSWLCAGGWGWYQLAKLRNRSSHLPF